MRRVCPFLQAYGSLVDARTAPPQESPLIFIAVKFTVRSAERDNWLPAVDAFTLATRQEPGNLFFEWSYSVENRTSSSCSKRSPTRRRASPT
ncbi:hypothetical protein GCM10020227_56040 [Streptomyces flavovirens]